jgi:hypothetical protein
MERCLSPEAKKSLNRSREDTLLWNAHVRYRFHKSLPLVAMPNRTSPTQLHPISVTLTWMVYSDYGQVPLCRLIPSEYPIKLLKHLPSPQHMPHVLSIIHDFFNRRVSPHWSSKIVRWNPKQNPASVSHTKRENEGKIKPTPTEMSSDEDIVVPVSWGLLLSADARS